MVKYFSPLPYYRKLTLHKIEANIYIALIFVTYLTFIHFIHLFAYTFIHWLTDSFLSSFLSLQPRAVLEGAWEAVLVVAVVAGPHIMRHNAAYADRPPAVAWDPWQV